MEVKEKNAKVWRKDFQGKNGEFYRYSVSVSKRTQDGRRVNAYIPVMFSKKSGAPEKIENGAICDFEGFMSVEERKDKDGSQKTTPMIVIMSVKFADENGADSFESIEEDMPF